MPGRAAILIVDGYAPRTLEAMRDAIRFPWIELCLREISRRSDGCDYELHVWDNAGIREHRAAAVAAGATLWPDPDEVRAPVPHAVALDELVERTGSDVEYLVTLDTDSLPVADGWLEALTGRLDEGASLVGAWRDEMASELRPFVHPSCLAVRRRELLDLGVRFSASEGIEPGQDLTLAVERAGRVVAPLLRSNARNPHFLLGGIYGDLVYHHAAGSRPAWFYASHDQALDERLRVLLRDAVFCDFDHVVAVLRGEQPNDIW